MRRLVAYCVPALLFALSTPSRASNDGVIVFVPRPSGESLGKPSVPAVSPMRGQYGGGFVEALLTGGLAQ